jgi:hypothetical protein
MLKMGSIVIAQFGMQCADTEHSITIVCSVSGLTFEYWEEEESCWRLDKMLEFARIVQVGERSADFDSQSHTCKTWIILINSSLERIAINHERVILPAIK